MKIKASLLSIIVVIPAMSVLNYVQASIVTGPFVPGSGTYDLVPNGGGENGISGCGRLRNQFKLTHF
jgi:hypothetical protein